LLNKADTQLAMYLGVFTIRAPSFYRCLRPCK